MAKKNHYRMPVPDVGQTIHYRHDWNDKPTAAIVVEVGAQTVNLHILHASGTISGEVGVRHKSDPDLINPNVAKRGFWEFRESDSRLQQIERLWGTLLEVCGTDEAGLEEIITKKRLAAEEAAIDAQLAEDKKKAEAEKKAEGKAEKKSA